MPLLPLSTLSKTRPAVDVLIVDDSEEMCRVLTRALLRRGLTVGVAPSALHALRVLRARPHLVVMADYSMPGPDGVELLRVVERRWPGARRILFTGWASSALVLESTAHRVVDKSVPLSLVVEIVLEELSRAEPP